MKITYNILREYLPELNLSPYELKDLFPYMGIEVEEFRYIGEGLDGYLVSGLIEEISEAKGASGYYHLKVSLGDRKIDVVSTAPNVRKGIKVVVALPGAVIKGNTIKEREIKGIVSQGNLLSLEEMGFDIDSEGVFELPEDFPIGISPLEYLGLKDWLYDLYIFPNRPDLLGIIGLAHEISAHTGNQIQWPRMGIEEICDEIFNVEVSDPEGCPVYTARIVKNVKVGPSPFDLQRKLSLLGQRPINNIVDITNYVMFELGQPIHAFDKGKVRNKIVVRRAKEGEKILCLDGLTRELNPEILVIADFEEPIAIAGIIGGENTSVSPDTRDIIIESAYFDRVRIRKAVQMLNVGTESSRRFERGGDPMIPEIASRRVAYLVKKIAGGEVCKINLVQRRTFEQKKIALYFKDLNRILGEVIEPEEVKRIVERLGFAVHKRSDHLTISVPSRRRDIEVWEDIAEEILKIYGYDRIKGKTESCGEFIGKKQKTLDRLVKATLIVSGFTEVKNIEFASPGELIALGEPEELFVKIQNPIHSELSVLRTSLTPGLLRVASLNLRRGVEYLRIFEVGKVFHWRGSEELPMEVMRVGLCVAGEIPKTWDRTEREVDIYDLLSGFESLRRIFSENLVLGQRDVRNKGFSSGGVILNGEKVIGYLGEVAPKIKRIFDIKAPVFVMELELANLSPKELKYTGLPTFPATSRDISVVIGADESIKEILDCAKDTFSALLEEYRVLDIFEGKPIPEGKKSVTLRFILRSKDRTLTQEEVDAKFNDFVSTLMNKGYEIRGLNA
ncbi:MAG: phenylalanine--tRNA ligase subunit beta [bacterium]|nr:phenylalanine--tRNA ligase subunit beta [bacterium]